MTVVVDLLKTQTPEDLRRMLHLALARAEAAAEQERNARGEAELLQLALEEMGEITRTVKPAPRKTSDH